MIFLGGLFVGCEVGMLNFVKIKGNYMVMKLGMFVVESIFEVILENVEVLVKELISFIEKFKLLWLYDELFCFCNFGFVIYKFGNFWGGVFNMLE